MISADVKMTRTKRSGGCIFFLKKYPQNLKYNVQESVFFI